jgi:hypothetical protein
LVPNFGCRKARFRTQEPRFNRRRAQCERLSFWNQSKQGSDTTLLCPIAAMTLQWLGILGDLLGVAALVIGAPLV